MVTRFFPIVGFSLSACTTAWQVESVQFQPVQTQLAVVTAPSAEVLINNRRVGRTPLEVPLDYEKEVRIERRRVSYWKTEPGLSLLLTLTSCGVYLPFSLIPADTESRLLETGHFRGNEFAIAFENDQGELLKQETVVARGEPKLSLTKHLGGRE